MTQSQKLNLIEGLELTLDDAGIQANITITMLQGNMFKINIDADIELTLKMIMSDMFIGSFDDAGISLKSITNKSNNTFICN